MVSITPVSSSRARVQTPKFVHSKSFQYVSVARLVFLKPNKSYLLLIISSYILRDYRAIKSEIMCYGPRCRGTVSGLLASVRTLGELSTKV